MEEAALRAAGTWGLNVKGVRADLAVSGSPERSEFRCVVECAEKRLVVLESIRGRDRERKQAIIDRLDFLAQNGLSRVNPYLRGPDGRRIVELDGHLWQASPYVMGVPLDRPAYAFEGWRGKLMAQVLLDLRHASQGLPDARAAKPFSILSYIDTLSAQIRAREPAVFEKFVPVLSFLKKRLAPVHDMLPVAFCHGDYHPLNMIWSEDGLLAVIDWEFCGVKPEMYDAALLVGCIGIEDPDALAGALVGEFIRALKAARVFSGASWRVLVEMVVAIRCAWLAEWLRTTDTEMIELETVYLQLLMDHADDLMTLWHEGSGPPGT
ncbi:MAG TPA: aminoglycoside phosphotransferase family protein [Deltaproteobacteria bacterium]|nr:aminoglycoside phosphotransferase family protein [Deltaproteobacteria bacterium]